MDRPQSPVSEFPPILKEGGWVDIGYDSALKFSEGKLWHRLNGKIVSRPEGWLMVERPLLVWILQYATRETCVDTGCKPA
jgi:hypothetical protein